MTKFILPLLLILCVPLMGDEKKDKEEFEKTKALAEKGDAAAQFNLGAAYVFALVVEKNFKEAVKWYRKAAEQGHAAAQGNLGGMYHNGSGVLEDYVTAYAWYNIAAANGNGIAKINKSIVVKDMTPEQIAKAQELSKEMVKKNPKLLKD